MTQIKRYDGGFKPLLSDRIATCRATLGLRSTGIRNQLIKLQRENDKKSWRILAGLNIDRRYHMDLAMERQEKELVRLSALSESICPVGVDVKTLHQLEYACSLAGSRILVLAVYTRSCGICSSLLTMFDSLTEEYGASQARGCAVFARHDASSEFDHVSDVARYYRIKSVPCVLFFVDGALVERLTIRDVRDRMRPHEEIRQEMHGFFVVLKQRLFSLIVKHSPSSRR
jgi:thiol-disulfide isomerase/thioredoxin